MSEKKCNKCKETKNTSEFNNNSKNRDGKCFQCRECDSRQSKIYYKTHKEERLIANKVYQDKNPNVYRNSRYKLRYGITVEDFTGKDHDGEPFFFYRRTCELWRGDYIVASVDGSCNSFEKKYRYRNSDRVCPNCGKPTIIKGKEEYGGGWLCFTKKGGCNAKFGDKDPAIVGQETGQIKNPDVADLANTILKMADKRALVAATLIATGLSEYFTQDMEDFVTGEFTEITKPAAKVAQPENIDQETGEIKEPIKREKPVEVITDEAWATFADLVQDATDKGVKLHEYNRAKMSPSGVYGASEYIKGKLAKFFAV